MRLDEFDYPLPDDRIAQTPVEPRDSARLLVDRGSAPPEHRRVRDLVDLLGEGDVLVVNDTRVIPARLRLQRDTGGAVELVLLDPLDEERRTWECLARPARKMQPGEVLYRGGVAVVRVIGRSPAGDTMHVELVADGDAISVLQAHGEMPLPPYITARDAPDERYQTVYANEPASSAAPTAGLHFTPTLLDELVTNGVRMERVELVVGLDTFKPVSVDDPRDHQIHSERYRVPVHVLEVCRDARRTVAVGTTSVRALESAAASGALSGRTRLFIHRPFEWKVVDLMMTNFHLPRTTLLLMIDAFVGPRWRRLYEEALAENYRFLSFGDAMLLDRRAS